MSQIILKVPSSVLGTEANDASDLLTSIQSGVTAAYEPQVIVSGGWDCYLRVMRFYLSIQPPDQRWAVIQRHWQPIVQSELALKKAEIYRGLSDRAFASTMKDIPSLLTPSQQELFIMQLRDTFEHTLSAVQQLNVAEPKALDRLLHILLTFLTNEQVPGPQSSHFQALADTSKDLIYELIAQVLGLIKKRGGSAQGAAEFLLPKLVEEPLQALVLKSDRLQDLFAGFLEYDLPELLFSDSRSAIVHMLRVMSRSTVQVELFGKTWTSAARHAGSNPDKAMSYQVLGELISALEGQSASQSQFSELIEGVVREATADNSSANFNAIVFLLGNIFSNFGEQLSDTVAHQLLSSLSESIEKKPHDQMAVKKLQLISACSPKLLSDYVITERGSLLVPSLLAQLEIETTHQDATIAILKSLIQYSSQNATQTSGLSHLMARSVVEQILISPDTGIGYVLHSNDDNQD